MSVVCPFVRPRDASIASITRVSRSFVRSRLVWEGGGRDGTTTTVDDARESERARERARERASEPRARGRRDDGVRARRRGGGERGDERGDDDDDERVERGTMARERRDDASRRARERARDGDG